MTLSRETFQEIRNLQVRGNLLRKFLNPTLFTRLVIYAQTPPNCAK